MSHLEQSVSIRCPLAQAGMRIVQFFQQHAKMDGDTATFKLQIAVPIPGRSSPLTLERSVIATVTPHHLPADMTPRLRVAWAPEIPGPFPIFAGELVVGWRDDYDMFTLRLSGDYTPPLGLFGRGFDATVGHHVARATASDLLRNMKTSIEAAFAFDESRKPQATTARAFEERHAPPVA